MYDEIFHEVNLNIIELPVELSDDQPHYSAFIKELPFISAEGSSKKEVYQQLAASYQEYVEVHRQPEDELEKTDEEQTSLLSAEQLLRYYDGESFDGFHINADETEE